MKATITKWTVSHTDKEDSSLLENSKVSCGASGGICYSKGAYFDSYVTDYDKALKRFDTITNTGHHSIADHVNITLHLEEVPKIMCMFLNNLNCYGASEKSGRYTEMTGETEHEKNCYEKWKVIFTEYIIKEYEDMDLKLVEKLAMENARYCLSVFTPTQEDYTTNLKQWNYILDWCGKYIFNHKGAKTMFEQKLSLMFFNFIKIVKPLVYVEQLRDFKERYDDFDFLDIRHDYNIYDGKNFKEQLGKIYCIENKGSIGVVLAQGMRHRTLNYEAIINTGLKGYEFYTPPILLGTIHEEEWKNDMSMLREIVPQGTICYIEESGRLKDFFLKTTERNCGRSQLEIMQDSLNKCEKIFLSPMNEVGCAFDKKVVKLVKDNYNKNGKCKMKGQRFKCKEPCYWGCEGSRGKKV